MPRRRVVPAVRVAAQLQDHCSCHVCGYKIGNNANKKMTEERLGSTPLKSVLIIISAGATLLSNALLVQDDGIPIQCFAPIIMILHSIWGSLEIESNDQKSSSNRIQLPSTTTTKNNISSSSYSIAEHIIWAFIFSVIISDRWVGSMCDSLLLSATLEWFKAKPIALALGSALLLKDSSSASPSPTIKIFFIANTAAFSVTVLLRSFSICENFRHKVLTEVIAATSNIASAPISIFHLDETLENTKESIASWLRQSGYKWCKLTIIWLLLVASEVIYTVGSVVGFALVFSACGYATYKASQEANKFADGNCLNGSKVTQPVKTSLTYRLEVEKLCFAYPKLIGYPFIVVALAVNVAVLALVDGWILQLGADCILIAILFLHYFKESSSESPFSICSVYLMIVGISLFLRCYFQPSPYSLNIGTTVVNACVVAYTSCVGLCVFLEKSLRVQQKFLTEQSTSPSSETTSQIDEMSDDVDLCDETTLPPPPLVKSIPKQPKKEKQKKVKIAVEPHTQSRQVKSVNNYIEDTKRLAQNNLLVKKKERVKPPTNTKHEISNTTKTNSTKGTTNITKTTTALKQAEPVKASKKTQKDCSNILIKNVLKESSSRNTNTNEKPIVKTIPDNTISIPPVVFEEFECSKEERIVIAPPPPPPPPAPLPLIEETSTPVDLLDDFIQSASITDVDRPMLSFSAPDTFSDSEVYLNCNEAATVELGMDSTQPKGSICLPGLLEESVLQAIRHAEEQTASMKPQMVTSCIIDDLELGRRRETELESESTVSYTDNGLTCSDSAGSGTVHQDVVKDDGERQHIILGGSDQGDDLPSYCNQPHSLSEDLFVNSDVFHATDEHLITQSSSILNGVSLQQAQVYARQPDRCWDENVKKPIVTDAQRPGVTSVFVCKQPGNNPYAKPFYPQEVQSGIDQRCVQIVSQPVSVERYSASQPNVITSYATPADAYKPQQQQQQQSYCISGGRHVAQLRTTSSACYAVPNQQVTYIPASVRYVTIGSGLYRVVSAPTSTSAAPTN